MSFGADMRYMNEIPKGGVWLFWRIEEKQIVEFRILTNDEYLNNKCHWNTSNINFDYIPDTTDKPIDGIVFGHILMSSYGLSIEANILLQQDLARLGFDKNCDYSIYADEPIGFYTPRYNEIIARNRQKLDQIFRGTNA